MNSTTTQLAIALAAGLLMGLFYFGLLWLTVQGIHRAKHPLALLSLSFVMRLAVILTAFYIVMSGHWERLAACLIGFLVARYLMIHRLHPTGGVRNADGGMSR